MNKREELKRVVYFIAIDPGAKGAVAILNEKSEVILLEDIPYVKSEKVVDLFDFSEMLKAYIQAEHHCILEKCQYTPAIKGSGAFTFGKTIGYTEAFLIQSGISHELVKPQLWKKEYSLLGKDKTASLEVARRLYLNVASKLLKTKDGRAEALLIAEYCRRKNGNLLQK